MNLNINMELNGDQKAFVNSTKQFADEYIVNNALEWDKKQIFPRNVFKKSAELGLAGIYVDQEDGGSGLKRLDAALIFEELAYACPSTSAFLSIHNMTAWMLSKYGCEQVKEKYMKNIITMQNICSYCLTEPGSGSDAAAMRTKGNPDSNNTSLNINGSKSFISGAGESDLYFVMMKTDIKSQDGQVVLRASGQVILFDGFLKVYEEGRDDSAGDGDDKLLPQLTAGESMKKLAITPEQHFTQPPPRYTEATLVKKMEELGIGRPSTYASIVTTIQDREYVRKDQNRLIPEDKGRIVTIFLLNFFKRYVEYDFTAALESQLDNISSCDEHY